MEHYHALQIVSLFAAVFALLVYAAVATKFLHIPVSFSMFGVGLIFNALQKVTLYLQFQWDSGWVWFFDGTVLPLCESICYALGSILLLVHHQQVINAFNRRIRDHFGEESTIHD